MQRLYSRDRRIESLTGIELSQRAALMAGVVTGTEPLIEKALLMKGGKIDMCRAVDEALKERKRKGIKQGISYARVESIRNIMDSLNLDVYQAMNVLKIPSEEQLKYIHLLSQ